MARDWGSTYDPLTWSPPPFWPGATRGCNKTLPSPRAQRRKRESTGFSRQSQAPLIRNEGVRVSVDGREARIHSDLRSAHVAVKCTRGTDSESCCVVGREACGRPGKNPLSETQCFYISGRRKRTLKNTFFFPCNLLPILAVIQVWRYRGLGRLRFRLMCFCCFCCCFCRFFFGDSQR